VRSQVRKQFLAKPGPARKEKQSSVSLDYFLPLFLRKETIGDGRAHGEVSYQNQPHTESTFRARQIASVIVAEATCRFSPFFHGDNW
jgi:hypothetical protein